MIKLLTLASLVFMMALTGCQTSKKDGPKKSISKSVKSVKAKSKRSKKIKPSNSATKLVSQYAGVYGINRKFALAVSYRESTHRCHLRGRHTEIGPLQIKPRSARFLGCTSKKCQRALRKSCKTQVKWGMVHLAKAQARARRSCSKKNLKFCTAYLHNRGIFSKNFRNRSGRAYAARVMRTYRRR